MMIILRKEVKIMVMVYVTLIIEGIRTFDSVPKKLQKSVKDTLYKMGLDENGHPLDEG